MEHTRKEKKQRQRQAIAPEQRPVELETQGKKKDTDPTLTNVKNVSPPLLLNYRRTIPLTPDLPSAPETRR